MGARDDDVAPWLPATRRLLRRGRRRADPDPGGVPGRPTAGRGDRRDRPQGRGRSGDRRLPDRQTGRRDVRPAVRRSADDAGRHALPLGRRQPAARRARCCCCPRMGYPNQAWRQGTAAWGVQFHLETTRGRRPGVGPRRGPAADRTPRPHAGRRRGGDGRGLAGIRPPVRCLRPAIDRRADNATAAAAGGAAMTRPAVRTPGPLRSAGHRPGPRGPGPIGLFSDAGTDPRQRGHPGRDLPVRPAGTGGQRPGPAVRGLHRTGPSCSRRCGCQPRFRGRLIAVLGASTVLSEHLAAWPEDWQSLLPEAPAEMLVAADGMRTGAVRRRWASIRTRRRAPAPRVPGPAVTGGKAIAALRRAYRSQLLIIAAHDLAPAVEPSLPTTALPAVCQALTDAGRRHPAGRPGRRRRRAAGRRRAGPAGRDRDGQDAARRNSTTCPTST